MAPSCVSVSNSWAYGQYAKAWRGAQVGAKFDLGLQTLGYFIYMQKIDYVVKPATGVEQPHATLPSIVLNHKTKVYAAVCPENRKYEQTDTDALLAVTVMPRMSCTFP